MSSWSPLIVHAARGAHATVTDTGAPDDSRGPDNRTEPTPSVGARQPPTATARRVGLIDRVGAGSCAGRRVDCAIGLLAMAVGEDAAVLGRAVGRFVDADADAGVGVGVGVGVMVAVGDGVAVGVGASSGVDADVPVDADGEGTVICASPSSSGENDSTITDGARLGPALPAPGLIAGARDVTAPNTMPLTRIAASASSRLRGVSCTVHRRHCRPGHDRAQCLGSSTCRVGSRWRSTGAPLLGSCG